MDHVLSREAMFLADDLKMNNGDFAFILIWIDIQQIVKSIRFKAFSAFRGRYRETKKLTEGAAKSFMNAMTLSLDIKQNNLISDKSIIKFVANLTRSPPFNRSESESNAIKVRRRRGGGGGSWERKRETRRESKGGFPFSFFLSRAQTFLLFKLNSFPLHST